MNKSTNIYFKNRLIVFVNSMPIQNTFIKSFTFLFSLHKICTFFVKLQVFFSPNMINYYLFIFAVLLKL